MTPWSPSIQDLSAKEKIKIQEETIYAPKNLDIPDLVNTLEEKKISHLYFDFDCLDPRDYNKTYYQVPNGTNIGEADHCIGTLQGKFEIVGSSVRKSVTTEVSELKPIANIINLLMK